MRFKDFVNINEVKTVPIDPSTIPILNDQQEVYVSTTIKYNYPVTFFFTAADASASDSEWDFYNSNTYSHSYHGNSFNEMYTTCCRLLVNNCNADFKHILNELRKFKDIVGTWIIVDVFSGCLILLKVDTNYYHKKIREQTPFKDFDF